VKTFALILLTAAGVFIGLCWLAVKLWPHMFR